MQVDSACMQIEGVPEIDATHGTALDMPSRSTRAPGTFPGDVAVGRFVGFPEHEVSHRVAVVFIRVDDAAACRGMVVGDLPLLQSRQAAVVVITRTRESRPNPPPWRRRGRLRPGGRSCRSGPGYVRWPAVPRAGAAGRAGCSPRGNRSIHRSVISCRLQPSRLAAAMVLSSTSVRLRTC